MTTLFTTKILKDVSEGKTRILDGGCGKGTQALYLARLNPIRSVHAYDRSAEEIGKANGYKQKYGTTNATFCVADHDYFQPPHTMDMIYTCESLVGGDELPWNIDPLEASRDIVRRRLSKFRETLTSGGVYVFTWGATSTYNEDFVKIAEACGLRHTGTSEGETYNYTNDWPSRPIFKTALIFGRSS